MSDSAAAEKSTAPAPEKSEGARIDNVKDVEQLVKQADLMKQQLNESNAAREALEKKQAEQVERLAMFEKMEQERLEKYAADNKPKADAYIKFLEETEGSPLPEDDKVAFTRAFTIPEPAFQRQAQRFMSQMENHQQQQIALEASKKTLEERQAEFAKEKESFLAKEKKLSELMSQAAPNMRASYAAASLNTPSFQAESKEDNAEIRKETVGLNASRLSPGEIMMPKPQGAALDFLAMYNYKSSIDLNASQNDPFGEPQKLFRQSMPAIPVHRQLYNENGEPNFPYSQRFHDPTIMSWLVNESGMPTADNLMDFATINSRRTFSEVKPVDDRPGAKSVV